jgi:hypothetical protein
MISEPLVGVGLKLTGKGFAPDEVIAIVRLVPTKTWRIGDAVQKTQLRRDTDGWLFELPKRGALELESLLKELLDIVEPHKDGIAEAARRFSLECEISFAVYVHDQTPALWFAADTMRRVSGLGSAFDIDLMLME